MKNRLLLLLTNLSQQQQIKMQMLNQQIKKYIRKLSQAGYFRNAKIFKFLFGLSAGLIGCFVIATYVPSVLTMVTQANRPTASKLPAPTQSPILYQNATSSPQAPEIPTEDVKYSPPTQELSSYLGTKLAAVSTGYKTSWIGNTFGGGNKWVQIQSNGMYVSPDGTVYTNSTWDEAGREVGFYKNGDVIGKADDLHGWGRSGGIAVTANNKYLYVAMKQSHSGKPEEDYPPEGKDWYCVRRYNLSGKPAAFPGGRGWDKSMLIVSSKSEVTGLATVGKDLYVSDPAANRIRVYNTDTMKPLRSFSVRNPGKITLDRQGNVWVIQQKKGRTPAKILHYSKQGKQLPEQISDVVEPTAIAVDNQGRLLVAENGPRQQVLIYNITNKPVQVGTFGTKGGIYAGTRGEVQDLKFYGLTGVGTDAGGNIYIAKEGFNESGFDLRGFSPSGALKWRLLGLQFLDNADADPATDGVDVFTKNEHFVMDYSKGSGKEWTYKAFTLDKFRYPDDGRLHTTPTAPFVRRLSGKRLLYLSSEMLSERLLIYRFDGEIAVPCGIVAKNHLDWPANQPKNGSWLWRDLNGDGSIQSNEYESLGGDDPSVWGWEVDNKGDIWQAAEDGYIKHYRYQGLDTHGCPIYSRKAGEKTPVPQPFTTPTRIKYIPEQDVMYLAGYTRERPNLDNDWGLVGTEIVRYDNWSKKRNMRWRIALPYITTSNPKLHMKSMDVAGDRVVAVSSKTAEVFVYNATTGEAVTSLKPGSEVSGESGWVDIPFGIRAFRRSNGEYLVFVEEDLKGKVIMYRMPA